MNFLAYETYRTPNVNSRRTTVFSLRWWHRRLFDTTAYGLATILPFRPRLFTRRRDYGFRSLLPTMKVDSNLGEWGESIQEVFADGVDVLQQQLWHGFSTFRQVFSVLNLVLDAPFRFLTALRLTNFQKEPIHFKFPQRALREHKLCAPLCSLRLCGEMLWPLGM